MTKHWLLSLALLLSTIALSAQTTKQPRRVQVGFSFAAHYDNLRLSSSDWAAAGIANDLQGLRTDNRPGFQLGILARFNLSPALAIVPQPLLSFQSSRVVYDFTQFPQHRETIEPRTIDLPVHLVYTLRGSGRVHPSLLAGGRFVYNISSQTDDIKLNVDRNDWAVDLGAGLEVHTRYFNLRPEVVYSFGLVNLADEGEDIFKQAVHSLHRDRLAFRLLLYY
jgi:hypothetical protein